MLRTRVVRQLLFEVAGLRRPRAVDGDATSPDAGAAAADAAPLDDERHEIETARKRAFGVVVFDAVAIVVLLLVRDPARGFLVLERSEEVLFTVGILVVAGHLGFRLAQALVLRNLERAWDDVPPTG